MSFPFNSSDFLADVQNAITQGRVTRANRVHSDRMKAMMKQVEDEAEASRIVEEALSAMPRLIQSAIGASDSAESEIKVPVMTLNKKSYEGQVQVWLHEKFKTPPQIENLRLAGELLFRFLQAANLNPSLAYSKQAINLNEDDDHDYSALQIVVTISV